MHENSPADDLDDTQELTALVQNGDRPALGKLLQRFRDRLVRVVRFRMDQRLSGRLDADDIVQESFVEAMERIEDFVRDAKMPFFVWLRFITMQKLAELHRRHLHAQARDADREISLFRGPLPGATSGDLASKLLGSQTSPSQALARAELKLRLEEALNSMDAIDREILALRHFEQLANVEVAQVLGLNPTAASNRYIRAVKRLRTILEQAGDMSGGR